MAKTEHYYTQFLPDSCYHVYNRSVDKRPLFLNDDNHIFFLKRYDKYLSPLVTTFSYALCGNHFHFGIQIKPEVVLSEFIETSQWIGRFQTTHQLVSHQFQSFFLSYAKAFNKQNNRVGALFQTPFKRCLVDTDDKLARMILYHHLNPQHHKLCSDFRTSRWTSYLRYLNNQPSKLPREVVFDLMGGRQGFIEQHNDISRILHDADEWGIED